VLTGRRKLLRAAGVAGVGLCSGLEHLAALPWARPAAPQNVKQPEGSRMLGLVPFSGEARVSMGEAFGAELDGRLYTDLATLAPEKPLTPSEQFYIRTRASSLLKDGNGWKVRIGGQLAEPFDLAMEQLRALAKPMGRHLMECAGNARNVHFGMMSVADWSGVSIAAIVERANRTDEAERVLIAGFDTYAAPSASSVPGASWSFAIADLEKAGAFLATEMNGQILRRDHGAPVRLVVPGWYGCTCIKWVNEISFTGGEVEATSQMQEYATRAMQKGVPKLARDFQPAILEHAAMPVRIEQWAVQEKVEYHVVGILWGGLRAVEKLKIRFNPEEEYVDVTEIAEGSNETWRFWRYIWKPQKTGSYLIRLRVAEPAVVARRLDSGYYMRSVEITEV
jgi:DMSO/TMAO reductase YedYZ molybdopterin-dependent catalytic subunit